MNKICPKCKIEKPNTEDYFYLRPNRNGKTHSYCKSCNHKLVLDRQRKFKFKIVQLKGGKCTKCGYDKCLSAMEFHHINPNEKDFNFAQYRHTSFEKNKKIIMQELDKCILVCANCHREIHESS